MRVAIIGAGLTGLSAALKLQDKCQVRLFESASKCGGLSKTESRDGFHFDYTGHFLHFNDSEVKAKVNSLLGERLLEVTRKSYIDSSGSMVPYPFQTHLYYLPEKTRRTCLLEFLQAVKESKPDETLESFYDWILSRFGEGIAREFMLPYNEKLWGVHPSEMNTEWMGRFVPRPSTEEVLARTLSPSSMATGYNASFHYPKGGIRELTEMLASRLNEGVLYLNTPIKKVDPKARRLTYEGGDFEYDYLIQSLPLKEFVLDVLKDPGELKHEAEKLRASSLLNVNIGWEGGMGCRVPEGTHWIYFPDKKISFYRVGFPSTVSSSLAPEGASSCYTEISYPSGGLPESKDFSRIEEKVIEDLIFTGIIPEESQILTRMTLPIDPAYVIYDDKRREALEKIIPELETKGILCGGRYGAWEYSTMEEAILWGERLAEKCL